MQPVYVNKLFELLEFLGIEQKAVVKVLGASKTQVSLWAHGKRPIPKKQALPFIWFVSDSITDALQQAMAETHPAEESFITVLDRLQYESEKDRHRLMETYSPRMHGRIR
jgi:predicted transcriptional regulator